MPIGNFAAVHSIKRKHVYRAEDAVGSTRKDKQLIHERDQAPKVRVLFTKYDKNRDALLDRDELKSLMVALRKASEVDVEVMDQDVDDMMSAAYNKSGISEAQLFWVMETWGKQTIILKTIEPVYEKYDVNKDGRLDNLQCLNLLAELNDNMEVTSRDRDFVLDMVATLCALKGKEPATPATTSWQDSTPTKAAWHYALAVWYYHGAPPESGVCCIVQ